MATTVHQRFASPEIRSMAALRLGQLAAVGLVIGAALLTLALLTYNPHDPSLNTATSQPATNTLGWPGAAMADLLLQGFGLAAAIPCLALLAWAWRMALGRPVQFAIRLICTLLAVPVLAGLLAALPWSPAWPATAGLGGAVGGLVGSALSRMGQGMLGPSGAALVLVMTGVLAAILLVLSLGLTAGEWRAAGSRAAGVARGSVRGGRGAASAVGKLTQKASAAAQSATQTMRSATQRPAPWADLPPLPADPRPAAPPAPRAPEAAAPAIPMPAPASAPNPFENATGGWIPPVTAPPPDTRPKVAVPAAKPVVPRQESLALQENGWQFPPLTLLSPAPIRAQAGPSEDALQANARLLETVLGDYGVQGVIREIRPGPVVTLYELEPAPGIRSARVIGLADDIARSLCVAAVRIATVSGRNVIGIEVPNAKRETVFLRELLASDDWGSHPGKLPLALGKDISGTPVIADLSRMPHLLIAGTTGSGKSVGINAMILSILFRLSPDQCRLIMIDPKMLELSVYEGIPHLLAPVVTEPSKAVVALKWTTREMERRYRAMSQLGVRNVQGYNERVTESLAKGEVVTRRVQTGFDSETGKPTFEDQALALKPLPYIVVVIDEMADLMMVAGKEVEAAVQRLAQMARAAGIHVIMATQRPSVDVITGTIKANFPTRISFQVISKFDSRTILGEQGAEQLLGMGDLLHMQGGGRIARVHGPFVKDEEVQDIVDFLRAQAEPAYDDEVTEGDAEEEGAPAYAATASAGDNDRGLFDQAVQLVAREGKASTSFIQRHLSIGYNRAAKLVEQMEKEGIITAANHAGKREVLARRTPSEDD